MFTFDPAKFFDGYRTHFGPLTQDLVDALNELLNQIQKDDRFEDNKDPKVPRQQLAYVLATFKWETAKTMRPIDEFGPATYFNTRYGPGTAVGKRLGNTEPGDGARFHGRGYVQLTGRANYQRAGNYLKVDLLADPEKAKDPDLAYRIAVEGMLAGWFTGKKLNQFFKDNSMPDWLNARSIINGHDHEGDIAKLGREFLEILDFSLK